MSVYQENGNEIWRYRFIYKGRTYFKSLPGVKTRKAALEAEQARRVALREGRDGLPSCGANFKRFVLEEFLPHIEANRSPMTFASYKWRCDQLIKAFGQLSLTEISTFAFERFKREQMKRETRRKKTQSPASVNRYGQILSSIYTRAEKLKLIESGHRPEIEMLREDNHTIRYLSFEEEKRLLKAAQFWPYLPDMIVLSLATGLRRQELFHLQKEHIDLALNVVHVMEGKGGKYRRIPLDPKGEARRILQRYCSESPTKWVFTSPHGGGRFTRVDRSLRAACEDAEINPPVTLHVLRHTFCTRLCAAGVDIRTIQGLAGHKDIETTMRYTHLVDASAHSAIRSLGEFGRAHQEISSNSEVTHQLKLA
jgi:site-specific recombinase XerD